MTLPLPPSRAPITNPSPPPDPKDVYIPAGSVGNPLGIRPSSNPSMTMTPNQRPLPSGPRSLRTAATVPTTKKPIVVGANWSAARSSGSASTSTNNSVPLTLSSSASTSTNSTIRSKVTDLSRILSYGSPSPPPASKPPPPPSQCQSGVSKWKRITGDDEKTSATSSDNSKTVKPSTPSTNTGQVSSSTSLPNLPSTQYVLPNDHHLKIMQALESVFPGSTVKPPAKPSPSDSSDDKKQGDVDIKSPSKKAKNGEVATLSSSKNSAPAKAQSEAASAVKASTSKRMWFHQLICEIINIFSNSSTTAHTSTTSQASPCTYWILISTFIKARTKSKSGGCPIKTTNDQYRLACYLLYRRATAAGS